MRPTHPKPDAEPEARVASYRIQKVAELTGVPQATLRAWERRYGIPTPSRTDSGYRLYGDAQVAEVLTMRRLCESGLAASEAAKEARATRRQAAAPPPVRTKASPPLGAVADRILAAVVAFDEHSLDRELMGLLLAGAPPDTVEEALVPAMRRIGQLWHDGELSVAQEHMASAHVGRFLRDVLHLGQPTASERRVVMACFAEEQHEFGLLLAATWISAWGLHPIVLGQRVPPAAIAEAVAGFRPRLVALSLTVPLDASAGRALVAEYSRACGDLPWVVGGLGARSLIDFLPAHGGQFAPESRADFKAVVARLLQSSGGLPPGGAPS